MPDPTPLPTTGVASGGRVGSNLQRSDQGSVGDLTAAVASLLVARPQSWFFAPSGWRDGFDQAISNIWQTPAWISEFGDSYLAAVKATDTQLKSWRGLLRAGILARGGYPLYGDYDACVDSALYFGSYTNTAPPWVVNNTNKVNFNGPFGTVPTYTDTAVATKLTWTAQHGYDPYRVDVVHIDFASGATWDYTAKDAAGVTIAAASGTYSTLGGNLYKRLTITSTTPIHSIVFGNQSASQRMLIAGVVGYKEATPNRGIGFATVGINGSSIKTITAGAVPVELVQPWWSADGTNGFGMPAQPSLFIMAMGINDCQGALGLRNYEATLHRLIQVIRRGQQNASILLVGNSFPDYYVSDSGDGTGLTNSFAWPLYLKVLRETAEVYNCAFVNFTAKWGEFSSALGFQGTDFHPTDAGNADMAATILAALGMAA